MLAHREEAPRNARRSPAKNAVAQQRSRDSARQCYDEAVEHLEQLRALLLALRGDEEEPSGCGDEVELELASRQIDVLLTLVGELARLVGEAGSGPDRASSSDLRTAPGPSPARADGLSEREIDVLRLIALGYTSAEIARQLYLSARTVEKHRAAVHRKLCRPTRADLVHYALQQGLLDVEPYGHN